MDCDDERSALRMNGVEKQLSFVTEPLRFVRRLDLKEFLDVGAGNEAVLLSADEGGSSHGQVALEAIEERDELVLHLPVELVDRLAGETDRDDGHATDQLGRQRVWRRHASRSTTIENP